MSTVLRPHGPHSAAVYWRRRVVVLLVLLAVTLIIGAMLFGGSSTGTDSEAAPPPTPTTTASPGASPDDDPSPNTTASGSPSASPAAAAPACQDAGIVVVAATDQGSYAAGVNPQITMTIRNESGSDCMRDIGSGANEIVITSGGHHVWSSDDCDPSQAGNEQTLPPGAEATVTVTWERKLSAPGCSGEAAPAQPGSYQVEGRNGGVVSEPARFILQ